MMSSLGDISLRGAVINGATPTLIGRSFVDHGEPIRSPLTKCRSVQSSFSKFETELSSVDFQCFFTSQVCLKLLRFRLSIARHGDEVFVKA